MDGWHRCMHGSADHSLCCLILNYITVNVNINSINLKGYMASGLESNARTSGVDLAKCF